MPKHKVLPQSASAKNIIFSIPNDDTLIINKMISVDTATSTYIKLLCKEHSCINCKEFWICPEPKPMQKLHRMCTTVPNTKFYTRRNSNIFTDDKLKVDQ